VKIKTNLSINTTMNRNQILWTIKQMTKAPAKYRRILNWLDGLTIDELSALVADIEQLPIKPYEVVPYLRILAK
jgi:hypothetical protein